MNVDPQSGAIPGLTLPQEQIEKTIGLLGGAFANLALGTEASDELARMIMSTQSEPNQEKKRIANRLNGFNAKDNHVWREITQRFGVNIKQPELLSIAQVVATNANIKLDRDAKRRKTVLIKWFEENWSAISPFLAYVVLEDQTGN